MSKMAIVVKNMSLPPSLKVGGEYILESIRTIYTKLVNHIFDTLKQSNAADGFYLTFQTKKNSEMEQVVTYLKLINKNKDEAVSDFEKNLNQLAASGIDLTKKVSNTFHHVKLEFAEVSEESERTTFVFKYDKDVNHYLVDTDKLTKCDKCDDIVPMKLYNVHIKEAHPELNNEKDDLLDIEIDLPEIENKNTDVKEVKDVKEEKKDEPISEQQSVKGKEKDSSSESALKGISATSSPADKISSSGSLNIKPVAVLESLNQKNLETSNSSNSIESMPNSIIIPENNESTKTTEKKVVKPINIAKTVKCQNDGCEYSIVIVDENQNVLINEKTANIIMEVHKIFECNHNKEITEDERKLYRTCPYCYEHSDDITKHLSVCQKAYVKCSNSLNGCNAVLPRYLLEKHENNCNYVTVLCKYCKMPFCPMTNGKHSETCPERHHKIKCPICSQLVYSYNIAKHTNECEDTHLDF